jgi:acetolactate synthase-1/2/3 large subunit
VVERTADFEDAFERAWRADTAALIELKVDPEATSPRTTLSAVRTAAMKGQA